MKEGHDAEHADTVRYECRRILGKDGCFAQKEVAIVHQEIDHFRSGLFGRDDLQKLQVTGRIEEVRPAEMGTEVIASSFQHAVDRDPRGIRGDDRTWFSDFLDARKDLFLDVQSLDHHLNDPVHIGEPVQMVFEVTGLYARCEGPAVQRIWIEGLCLF